MCKYLIIIMNSNSKNNNNNSDDEWNKACIMLSMAQKAGRLCGENIVSIDDIECFIDYHVAIKNGNRIVSVVVMRYIPRSYNNNNGVYPQMAEEIFYNKSIIVSMTEYDKIRQFLSFQKLVIPKLVFSSVLTRMDLPVVIKRDESLVPNDEIVECVVCLDHLSIKTKLLCCKSAYMCYRCNNKITTMKDDTVETKCPLCRCEIVDIDSSLMKLLTLNDKF